SDATPATENMTDSLLSADMSAAGEVTVTVSYPAGGGTPLTTTFTVTVSDPASVEVTLKSVKVNVGKDTYFQGDAFDLSDYTLTLTMSDNSTQTVALLAEHLTNQPDMTLIGEEQRINISYTYKGVAGTAYFHIIVKTDAVRSIELKTQPTLEYKECDMFEIGSAALNVTYDSGNKGEVAVTADMLDLSKVDMSVAGTYTATLTYQGKSLDLTVKVTARDFFTGIAADLSVPADITVYIPANVTALKLGGKAVDSANYSWASNVLTVKKEAFANYTNSGALVLTATTADKEYDVRLTLADKIIKQASDFAYINEHLDGYYVLGNDIDMSTLTDFAGIGTVVIDLRPGTTEADEDYIPQVGQGKTFTGTFDGMGYALKNWTFGCTELDEQDHKIYSKYQGISLFNNIGKSGVVRNVAIENFSLDLGKHNSLVATINEGLIENVIVKSGELTSWYTHGAAIAAINEGTVRNSINLVTKYTSMGNAVDLPMIAESQNGKTENLYNLAIGDKAFSKTETQLKTAETYALPASAWQIVDGIYPMLVSAKYISMQATLAEGYNLIEGLDLDTAKITVKGILVSGAEVTIEDAVFFGFDKTLADKQTITVVADGVICELEVDVYAKSVASIAWATEPNKTFTQGATFDNAASAKITVNYNNNTSDVVNVTADMVDSSAVDMNTAGDYTVKVSYGGKELTYTVSVKDSSVVVTELTLAAGLDTNAKYYAGETIDFSNVTLTVTYSDGTEDTVKVTNNVSYTDEVGEQVVTYSYGGKTVTQTITVLATPTAVTYTLNTLTEGEKFTYNTADGFAWFTNGSFTATYKNGGEKPDTTATLTADNTTVAGTLTSGKNVTVTLTVAVDEKHSFEVEVTFGLLYREIKTAADLQDVHNNLAGAYVLANDIDMSGEEDFNTIGVAAIHEYGDDNKQLVINDEAANWQTATDRKGVPFTGNFDGNG
ncbi:MAG: bacterial Ig-like domain-containing protein, partial [Clostridia bacterium]|nr:bacterial Ig-like domain-containing protein [Clostridia bacterium]